MRAREFIVESDKSEIGWQEQEIFNLPKNLGKIVFGERIDEYDKVVEVIMIYYNIDIYSDYENGVICSLRIKNDLIWVYDYQNNKNGKIIGKYQSIEEAKKYFSNMVAQYIQNIKLDENMEKKFTGDDLLAMVPGLSEKIDSKLSRYGKVYPRTNEDKKSDISEILVKTPKPLKKS